MPSKKRKCWILKVNKVFVLPPQEDWIVDRLVKEWYEFNADISTKDIMESDVVWLLADWCFNHIDQRLLKQKKVITSVHHIVPEKWTDTEKSQFMYRDAFTDVYHVPNRHTADFIRNFTKKSIIIIPYWANQFIWKKTSDKKKIRESLGIRDNEFVIGSFQRDTEGKDLISPKLEKGPDILADVIIEWNKNKNIHVLLAGWRRQYIIKRLEDAKIKYTYIERPDQTKINELYQSLDLYPVTSRHEGGPQSIIECGLLDVPVISRSVGIAEMVIDPISINNDVIKAIPTIPNVESLKIPVGFSNYRDLINNLCKS